MMDKDTTRSLSRVLEKTRTDEEAEQFIEMHSEKQFQFFHEYLNDRIASKKLVTSDVIKRSGISRNYVYNILNGVKKNPGRDKVIALCIGASLTFREMQKGLEIAGAAPLYPRNPRDIRIAVAVNQQVDSVLKLNLILEEHGLTPLDI